MGEYDYNHELCIERHKNADDRITKLCNKVGGLEEDLDNQAREFNKTLSSLKTWALVAASGLICNLVIMLIEAFRKVKNCG